MHRWSGGLESTTSCQRVPTALSFHATEEWTGQQCRGLMNQSITDSKVPVPSDFMTIMQKLNSRLKNNLYYYRSNYLLILLMRYVHSCLVYACESIISPLCPNSFFICFVRNPMALLALVVSAFGLLCLNDPFATSAK